MRRIGFASWTIIEIHHDDHDVVRVREISGASFGDKVWLCVRLLYCSHVGLPGLYFASAPVSVIFNSNNAHELWLLANRKARVTGTLALSHAKWACYFTALIFSTMAKMFAGCLSYNGFIASMNFCFS